MIGDFIFMLNTDWMAKKQLNVNSINRFYNYLKRNQNSIIQLYDLTDLTLDHVFHTKLVQTVNRIGMYGLLYILNYSLYLFTLFSYNFKLRKDS